MPIPLDTLGTRPPRVRDPDVEGLKALRDAFEEFQRREGKARGTMGRFEALMRQSLRTAHAGDVASLRRQAGLPSAPSPDLYEIPLERLQRATGELTAGQVGLLRLRQAAEERGLTPEQLQKVLTSPYAYEETRTRLGTPGLKRPIAPIPSPPEATFDIPARVAGGIGELYGPAFELSRRGAPGPRGEALMETVLPEGLIEAVEEVPVVGGAAARTLELATTPAIAAIPLTGVGVAPLMASIVGGAVLGEVGEATGIPGGELVGELTGFALGPAGARGGVAVVEKLAPGVALKLRGVAPVAGAAPKPAIRATQREAVAGATERLGATSAAPPLIEGGTSPSMNLWRTLERAHTRQDFLRLAAERLHEVGKFIPGLSRLVRTVASPSATMRLVAGLKQTVIYTQLADVQAAELAQRVARFYKTPFKLDKTQRIAVGERRLAFGDVFARPDKYRRYLTKEQREWIRDARKLIDDVAQQYEQATGEVLRDPTFKGYWPRFTIDESGRAYIRRPIGAKQSPQKQRMFEEMEEGIGHGVPYAGPIESLDLYVRSVQKMTRDALFVRASVEDGLARTLSAAFDRRIAAMREAIAKSPADPTPEEAARVQQLFRRIAKMQEFKGRRLAPGRGEVSGITLGPGFGRTVLDRETARMMKTVIGPGRGDLRFFERAASVPRLLVTGLLDVGYWLIQGQILFWDNPAAWSKALGRGMQAMFAPGRYARFVATNPKAKNYARWGGDVGLGSEVVEAGRPGGLLAGRVLGAIPRTAARGFDGYLAGGRVYKFDALANIVMQKEGPEGMYRLSRYVGSFMGTPSLRGLGISTTQRQVENAFIFFSSRYTRSIPGMVGYLMGNGVLAADARVAMAKFLFGGLTSFYGIARATGMSHEEALRRLDPRARGEFLSIPVGGTQVGIGGAWRSMAGAVAGLTVADNWDFDTWPEALKDNPIVRALRTRTSPLTGSLIDIITGEDFLGYPSGIDTFAEHPEKLYGWLTRTLTPLNIEAVLEARGPWWVKAIAGGVETFGGRAFPTSPYRLRNQNFRGWLEEQGREPVDWGEAATDLKREWEKSERGEELSDEIRRRGLERGNKFARYGDFRDSETEAAVMAQDVADREIADPAAWIRDYQDRWSQLATLKEGVRRALGIDFTDRDTADLPDFDRALDAYLSVDPSNFRLPTGEIDWDRWDEYREGALQPFAADIRQRVKAYLRRLDTSRVKEYRRARELRNEFFERDQAAWAKFTTDEGKLQGTEWEEVRRRVEAQLPGSGYAVLEDYLKAKGLGNFLDLRTQARRNWLINNPKSEVLLIAWGFRTPRVHSEKALDLAARRGVNVQPVRTSPFYINSLKRFVPSLTKFCKGNDHRVCTFLPS